MAESVGKTKNSFTSYIQTDNSTEDESVQETLKPKLLPGELVVISAKNVALQSPLESKSNEINHDVYGLLVLTNFKLSFVTNATNQSITYQENILLGRNDVTLLMIDRIYQIVDKKKRSPIGTHTKISSKIDGIHIICKNFRMLRFGFKQSEVGEGKRIAEALAKFAFPNQHNLMFSYMYREKYYNSIRNMTLFTTKLDWSTELTRCGATGWRVLSLEREDNIPSGSLPMHFVIPRSVSEIDYLNLSNCFRNGRSAVWVYSLENASLVRMGELMPTITDTKQENTMLEIVRKCDPFMRQPYIMELSKCLPSIQDVSISYIKLRELCTPETTRQFMHQDGRFNSLLEKSCWLLYVSLCLNYSNEAATRLRNGETVVIQENDGRDMCCVISSLTQILLDPYFRTISGLQTLIQKDWVALGHPFSDRLGHVINNDTTEQSPLLLLFLDCTWQLIQQFPSEFEYSETFLTTIWDSAFVPIFDTFQFNSEHDRQAARKNENLILRPLWDWGEQFTDKDLVFFSNPLYKKPVEQSHGRASMAYLPSSAVALPGLHKPNRMSLNVTSPMKANANTNVRKSENRYLIPKYAIKDLDIWTQCYYRWLPVLDIQNGGSPQIDLFNRWVLSSISKLQQALQSRDFDDIPITDKSNNDNHCIGSIQNSNIPLLSSFFPFTRNTTESNALTDILNASTDMLAEGSIFDGLSVSQEHE